MKVFNVICQVIFYSCVAFSLVMFIYYKIRQHIDRKRKLAQLQQEELDKEIKDDNDKQGNSEE